MKIEYAPTGKRKVIMLPVISAITTAPNMPTANVASAAPVAASEAVVGRLPQSVVAPSVTLPEMTNNGRGGGYRPFAAVQESSPAEKIFTPGIASRVSTPTLNLSNSTLFLAQLMGQASTTANVTGLSGNFVDYSTFVQYAMVKYKPSHAFIPPAEPSQIAAPETKAAPSAGDQVRAAAREANHVLQAVAARAQQVAAPPPVVTASSAPAAAATAAVMSQPANNNAEKADIRPMVNLRNVSRGGIGNSLVIARGVEAYQATTIRNSTNLSDAPVAETKAAAAS